MQKISDGKSAPFDQEITIFTPEGKILQIEYAMKAVKLEGLTSVAIKGADCVVVAAQKKKGDKLKDPSTSSNLFLISRGVGCVMTGHPSDSRFLVRQARVEAHSFKHKIGYDIPLESLARRMADFNQLTTQNAAIRLVGCDMMLISIDERMGPSAFKIDPSGRYRGIRAISAGAKEADANKFFEEEFEENMSEENVMLLAIQCLRKVSARAVELEIGVVSKSRPVFTILDKETIEQLLAKIANKR